ncbi:hypothetical protein G7Y89_g3708 [Cudoniella acicularis]|uniref:ABC transporter domain-containing protein n=1 Tax=Cudoniella acicularis TaxID=354080 RepID=A0A8H4RTU5_9HELO|nr:hypothetical protein G7Y89_g3708 [Cudoniella acicularis]
MRERLNRLPRSRPPTATSLASLIFRLHPLSFRSLNNVDNPEGKPIFGSNSANSPLNPHDDKFNVRAWATSFAQAAHERGQSFRQVGLCFQNLNVFGYGTPTDFQKNVGNIWLALPGMFRRLFSRTAGGHTRIDILRQFDSNIRASEMCVVLGPPGSGCSTLLKTMAGEMNGIYVNEARQTTPDFLTSMTFPAERISPALALPQIQPRAPAPAPADSRRVCKRLEEQPRVQGAASRNRPIQDAASDRRPRRQDLPAAQAVTPSQGTTRQVALYTLTYTQQVQLCFWLVANTIMALIISSLYYNTGTNTAAFYGRAVILFIAILFNTLSSMLEIMTLYAQRAIVEKQSRYAFYHPSAESYASALVDFPLKVLNTLFFNLVFYFMTNLNREPGPFFFYLLMVFLLVVAMSGVFKSIASLSRTEQQAMVLALVLLLALLIFTGFVVPIDYMLGWCRWINYVNPVAYGYEALMVNEFHNRNFSCSAYIPDYANATAGNIACNAVGAVAGRRYVNGDDHINSAYSYYHSHKWRNVATVIAMAVFTHLVYFIASKCIQAKKSKGEVLVFRRGFVPLSSAKGGNDVEKSLSGLNNVCHNIKIKGKPRRILDHVDGWVKPGTLTALMGVSGAGKTSLLDCLADRRMGVGVITGYLHFPWSIVHSNHIGDFRRTRTDFSSQALNFSALLRQPANVPKEEKLAYVDEVIKLLDMQEYANAVISVLGEGLSIEQRKRLTIAFHSKRNPYTSKPNLLTIPPSLPISHDPRNLHATSTLTP